MTITTADQATLRQFPHSSRLGLLIFRPTQIASAQTTTTSQGATQLTVTGYSEDETPVRHYALIAGSTAGSDDGGKTRFKSKAGSVITVAQNDIEWADYPFITILRVIEPVSILPDRQNDLMDGTVAYTDGNTKFHPLGRMGPPTFSLVNEVAKFYSNSQAIADGASVSSHSWVFPSGSPSTSTSAGSAATPIEVTWSAATGHQPHYITYTATDSNGKTHTRYSPHWVLNSFDECFCAFEIEDLSGDYGSGTWQLRIRVYDTAGPDEFPQDAMIMLVAEDRYAGQKTSIGGNWDHREDTVFVGWISQDTVFLDDEDGSVSFEALGSMGKAAQMISWPANLEYRNSPSEWDQISGMTCDRAAFHILTERSTLDMICDVNLTGNTKVLRFVDIPETSVQAQLDEYCLSPIGARALSDRQASIYLSRNPNLRPLSERTSIPTHFPLELADVRADPGLELGVEEHEKNTSQIDFIGFSYNGQDAVAFYSLAPGSQYTTGDVKKIDGVLVTGQAEANTLSGMYLAEENNIWKEVKTPTWNMRIFDIVPEEYITLSLAASDTLRSVVWDTQKLICRTCNITYDRETQSVRVNPSLEKDSFGPPGVGGHYPKSPPKGGSNPNPNPKLPNPTLAAWNGFFILPGGATNWSNRGELDNVNFGCLDPWWFFVGKAESFDRDKAIFYAAGASGLLKKSENGGFNWVDITKTDPPNTWSDATAPTASTVAFIWVQGDIYRNGRFYALATYQGDSDKWRSWVLYTDNDWVTSSWLPLNDGVTLQSEAKAIALDVNQFHCLITLWEDDGAGTTQLALQRWDPDGTMAYVRTFEMGSATLAQVNGLSSLAFPVVVTDDPKVWYIAGRMNAPQSLSSIQHIIKSTDEGGSWASFISDWSASRCYDLIVGPDDGTGNRKHWAVRRG